MALPSTDVLVIGGGPAGLATAIHARLAGFSVRVLERSRPPLDKACGEGLMPDAVRQLEALGVKLAADECRPLRGIRYIDGDLVAEGAFPQESGLGVRRLHLHRALAARAAAVGVDLRWGVAATGLSEMDSGPARRHGAEYRVAGAATDQGLVPARWVVGADGLLSRVRRWAALDGAASRGSASSSGGGRFGVRRHYACRPWSESVEVYWGERCEAYVTPVGPDEVGVAILWSGRKAGFDSLLAEVPALAGRLAGAPRSSSDRGAGPLAQRVRGVRHGNVALVGDAAGYLDAITGEGIAVALHQAAALVAALRTAHGAHGGDGLAAYAAAHRRIGRLPAAMTGLVKGLDRWTWLRRRALRALAAEPALFCRLLGLHARTLPVSRVGVGTALRLACRLVVA
jgi:flavin-dependent dehydrogenase